MLMEYLEIPRIYKQLQIDNLNEKNFSTGLYYHKKCQYKNSSAIFFALLDSENHANDKPVIYNNLGCSEYGLGKFFSARDHFTEALSNLGDKDINEKISVMLNLAFTQYRIAEYPNATKTFNDIIILLYSMKSYNKFYLALVYTGLACLARERGDLDEAMKSIQTAVEFAQEFIDTELTIVYIYEIFASVKRMKGIFQDSHDISTNNLKILNEELKSPHPIQGMIKNSIALSLRSMASYKKALEEIVEGNSLLKNFYDDLHPDVALIKNTQGLIYHNMDLYYEGMNYINESMKIYRFSNLSNHPDMAKFYNNLGLTYKGMSRYKEAIDNYQAAIEVLTSTYGPNHSGIAPQYNNIGVAYKKMGQYREALSCYMKCYRILETSMTSKHPLVADILLNIGYLMHLMDSREEVHPCFKRSMIIYSKFYGSKHMFTGKAKLKNVTTEMDKMLYSLNHDF